MIKTTVWITTSFEHLHFWPDAPSDASFLQHPHRHVFHVKLGVEVSHDNRDIEFIKLKREVDLYIAEWEEISIRSCEMMAKDLLERFSAEFVEVSEDGENGARVERA